MINLKSSRTFYINFGMNYLQLLLLLLLLLVILIIIIIIKTEWYNQKSTLKDLFKNKLIYINYLSF